MIDHRPPFAATISQDRAALRMLTNEQLATIDSVPASLERQRRYQEWRKEYYNIK